ncbi:MAG TPA: ATP-binding protein [Tepidisphaeraceae bacterium]|nr:ATP-binding protein [Tepidisphaeraceae bacterium]
MAKRFRQLEISLAAKCQLLFGAAVVLIIGAALAVPWQRMEQLMDQINERVARVLADRMEADHLTRQLEARNHPTTHPATRPLIPSLATPTTAPSSPPSQDKPFIHMTLLRQTPNELTRFETRALEHYRQERDIEPYVRRQRFKDGSAYYRFARPLYARQACLECHLADLPPGNADPARAALLKKPPVFGVIAVEIPYQVDENQYLRNRIFLLLAGLLAGTLAIVVFYLITTRLILGPVRVLRETAEKVSKGDLNIRSDISTGDEFQKLSETFNRMLSSLQLSEDQLRAINKNLDLKLGQLAESNLALYESNRLKNEILANVSHELRTPLNSILGFAELLKDASAPNDAKTARYIQNILVSGRNLLDLINDLLDLAKIEAGRMEVRSEPLSLADLFEGLTNILKPLAEKNNLALVATVCTDVPIMHSDPAKLQQILYNFLSNAIKFSPPSGRIDLRAERCDEEHVRISVTDQGPGIPKDKQTLIFEKFRQIDGSATREHGGTGLGLAISKDLTSLLGGEIGVHSTPGQGASFWVILPLKIEAGAQKIQLAHQNA